MFATILMLLTTWTGASAATTWTGVGARAPAPASANGSDGAAGLDALSFLEGDWAASFEMFADTWGADGAGKASGRVTATFGPNRSWFEMYATTDLPGSGAYAVRVLIHGGAQPGAFSAYVVNSFGSGATYAGRLNDDSTLVFLGDFGRTLQRVTYEKRDHRIHYVAEESFDGGATWAPHTESWWAPASNAQPTATGGSSGAHIAHVEISVRDAERAVSFYSKAFGWSFAVLPDETGNLGYWLGHGGDPTAPTVGIFEEPDGGEQPVVTIYVGDIDDALARIRAEGGSITRPTIPIPGSGWLAYITDPEGNRLGIFEEDPSAPASGSADPPTR